MKQNNKNNEFNRIQRFSIRKYSFGAASVAIATYLMFMGNGAVYAAQEGVEGTEPKVGEVVTPKEEPKQQAPKAESLDKSKLIGLIAEIETNLSDGTYNNKTDESLSLLKSAVESAKSTVVNATSQEELEVAYRSLFTIKNTKLKSKPVEKKETPEVDTTNGKETVGKKAENTEPKVGTNAIENSGSHDSRNGKEIDKENAFRTEATAKTHEPYTRTEGNISYTVEFSDDAKKEIYAYNEEDTNIEISVNSTAGKISKTFVKGASGQYLDRRPIGSAPNQEETDGWGWTYHSVLTPTQRPVTVRVTGKPNDKFKGLSAYTKQENQHAVLGDRYLQVYDEADGKIEAGGNAAAAGFFKMVVKSQTYKYSIQQPELNGDKIGVADINNLTATDIQKIKDQINIEYSKTSTDARLTSKKGTTLDNKSEVVENIEVNGQNIVVTYKDGSTDTASISDVARTNEKPTVEIEYSDPAPDKKEVYVYASEFNTFDIKIKDDSGKLASAELRRGSNQEFKDVAGETNKQDTQYGFTANKFTSETTATADNPTVITYSGTPAPEGAFTRAKLEEVTKGENAPGIPLGWRFVKAIDKDGEDARGNGRDVSDPTAVNVILKPQNQKYDIQTPAETDKVAVDDVSDVSEAEFNKIKEKIKIEYSKNNIDARLTDKKGQVVENQEERIASIKKDGDNVVVTYKDGSTDTRPLTDFARTNNAPEVTIPYSTTANGKKDVYIYANEDIDIDIKYTDDLGKIKSATVNRGGNQPLSPTAANPNVLDNEYDMTLTPITAETEATAENPAIVKIRGKVTKDTAGLKADKFPKGDNDEYRLVTRYATAVDTDGKEIRNVAQGGSYATDPGSFSIVLKSQTKKYDIRELADADKTVVTDITNIPQAELDKIKENIPLEYSKKNEDKNLEAKKGTAVEKADAAKVVETLEQDGENLVVTYKDGSKDTIPVEKVVKLDKQPAIDAVTNKATDQIAAIKGNDNLTQAEKDKAIAKLNEDKQAA